MKSSAVRSIQDLLCASFFSSHAYLLLSSFLLLASLPSRCYLPLVSLSSPTVCLPLVFPLAIPCFAPISLLTGSCLYCLLFSPSCLPPCLNICSLSLLCVPRVSLVSPSCLLLVSLQPPTSDHNTLVPRRESIEVVVAKQWKREFFLHFV